MLQALFGVAQGARAPVLGQVPNLVIRRGAERVGRLAGDHVVR
jgi:hypothetical protein